MAPERPTFFEGQVLAAEDLTSTVEYGRAEVARHERYLHDWGIAEGLELTPNTKTDSTGTKYAEVMLGAGLAYDGNGREIVVPAPVMLNTSDFIRDNGASPKSGAYYPVLLQGADNDAPAPALTAGACGPATQPTRKQEGYVITYGGLGADPLQNEPSVPDVTAGPVPAAGQQPWTIQLGSVQWDSKNTRFTDANGAGRRYAGVKADTVAARSGTLTLRAQPSPAPGQPVLIVGGDPPFTFGLYKGGNAVDARLTVSAEGNVVATGTIKGVLAPGEMAVQSGTATDGVIIPLPPGITDDQVASGAVTLYLHLTPHTPQSTTQGSWYVPVECDVDSNRQLTCQVLVGSGTTFSTVVSRPGAADYLIVATVGSANGATT
jgi:hypothetical protein